MDNYQERENGEDICILYNLSTLWCVDVCRFVFQFWSKVKSILWQSEKNSKTILEYFRGNSMHESYTLIVHKNIIKFIKKLRILHWFQKYQLIFWTTVTWFLLLNYWATKNTYWKLTFFQILNPILTAGGPKEPLNWERKYKSLIP
jgi:hypothetical protein